MKPSIRPRTRALHDAGQSLWIDRIDRAWLDEGALARCIDEGSVTGLTSNPAIFERAFAHGAAYGPAIRAALVLGLREETLFFELAVQDLTRAADLLRPAFEASGGLEGWVSLEVSPMLADNSAATIEAAARLHASASRPNLFIKIPGTPAGLVAVEQALFEGVPVNVTLLFSCSQWAAAAQAHLRALERRQQAGLDLDTPAVASVASVFVSRWDAALDTEFAPALRNRLGSAVAMQIYRAHLELLASPRWQALASAGARPQRLLWASTGSKDPALPDTYYVEALAAPGTVITLPEATLWAYADHGHLGPMLPADGGYCEAVLDEFRREGLDVEALGARLQRDGVQGFVIAWGALLGRLREQCAAAIVDPAWRSAG